MEEMKTNLSDDDYESNFKIYLSQVSCYDVLTEEEEKNLFLMYKNGDMNAYYKLINHNLKLVISCAKEYYLKNVDLLDLIQEGNIGLMKAIENFDLSYNVRFSTYAYIIIKRSISMFIMNKYRPIRLPNNLYMLLSKIIKARNLLEKQTGSMVSNEQIATYLNMDVKKVEEILNLPSVVSLEENITNDEDKKTSFIDVKKDTEDVIGKIEQNIFTKQFMVLINNLKLSKRDKEIILYRYGFVDGINHTLHDLAKKYNLSFQRIEQIEYNALKEIMSDKNIRRMLIEYNYKFYDKYNKENVYEAFSSYDVKEVDLAISKLSKKNQNALNSWFILKDRKDINEDERTVFYKACYEMEEILRKNSKIKVLKK